ncbi:cytochrome c551 [Granulicella aggregans]|uniref:Cytochrome c551 n=1 Tax=Granulicella aggregans TaxID=474949 RepID=A0A7W7ZF55_9BACT|nr:cytochrome c [Granulicella aggregans]MBB5058677.1 cytochrome c551 [Granulicella aggregans]
MRFDLPHLPQIIRPHLATAIAAGGAIFLSLLLAAAPHTVHASSKRVQAVGAAVFHDKGCQHCHGADLTGTDRGPDLSTVGKKWHKGRIEKQIREGGNGMPAFGDVLQPDEIKSLVDYLSAKRKPAHKGIAPKAPAPSVPAKPSDDDSGD